MRRTDTQSAAVPIKLSYFNGRVVSDHISRQICLDLLRPPVSPGLPSGQTAAPTENHPRGAMFPRGGWPFMRKPGQKLSTLLIVRSASGYYKTARSARDRKGKDLIGNPYHLPFRNARTSGRAGTEGAAPGRVTAMALARVARVRGSRPQSSPRMPRRK